MADGNGTKLAGRANYQNGEYVFAMNAAAASTHNLEIGDSGKTYLMSNTVARTINLPSPTVGVCYKFIMTDTTADSSIVATAAIIKGGIHAGNSYLTLAGTTIVCELAGAIGDCLSFVSDGTNWYVNGQSAHAAGFSVS
tara:strand:+ start:771 stop:1187 length:417 start_codon:yes stop_codon:yes gene_type:complete